MQKKKTKFSDLSKLSKNLLPDEPNSVFDKGENTILQIICAILMFAVIGFVLAGIFAIVLNLNASEFIGLGFAILLLYIVYRLFGIIFAYALLIILPLIIFLLTK